MSLLERAKGWPADRMSRVTRAWEGQTVVCLASGPSLTVEQVERVRAARLHCVAVNDCYRIAPWADVVYFADSKWFAWQKDKPEWQAFAGEKCTIQSSGVNISDTSVHVLKNAGHEGLSVDATAICTGSHSGYQGLNIATLSGAKRILLLGYDCKRVNGKKHWFGDHPDGSEPPYEGIRRRYDTIVPIAAKLGIEIVNCTPGSWIECFPMRSLESVLPHKVESVV